MTGSLMAASQPAAKLDVTDHQAETTQAKEEIADVEHALCSTQIANERNMMRRTSSLDWEIAAPI
jgi:hypothetical protein